MVRAKCDPVFDSAGVGFIAQVIIREEIVDALLWEAKPGPFAKRYPDSGLVESYGSSWPPPCVDFWAYIRPAVPCAVLIPDGWSHPEIVVELSGDGRSDGMAIGRAFASILRVPEPGA